MVFWDSRTIHAGREAIASRAVPNFRCVAYVCYTPRALATAPDLARKGEALTGGHSTSHWPHRPKLFPLRPREPKGSAPSEIQLPPSPVLSDLGRRLAGL